MSTEEGPPQRSPQISPDGKWVWDGTEWQPVAGRDSGHQAVFPAFNAAAMVDPSLPTVAQPPPMQVAAPAPIVNYAVNYATPETNVPLWQVKPGHWNKYLYVVAGVVVLVMVGIFLSSLGPITLFGGTPQAAAPTPAPSLLSKRSDYESSNHFLTVILTPQLITLNKVAAAQLLACNGVPTTGCQQTLVATNDQVNSALSAISTPPAPVCIAPYVSNVTFDLKSLQAFLTNALRGYQDSSRFELVQAIAGFNVAYRKLQSDDNAILKAQGSLCDTQLTGP